MIGGVAAGLGNYLHIDPTILRLAFLVLALFSGGAFVLAYVIMWVLIPTAGSTANTPNEVMQENINEMKARVRGVANSVSNSGNGGATNGGTNGGQPQLTQGAGSASQTRANNVPLWLIGIGAFFLLANFGLFHGIAWGMWWPLLLVGLGVLLLVRRNQP
jgi:phage shock protein PspC (stress-responsive transcriptional regulator)